VLAESTFNRNSVTDSRLKFDLTLSALSDEILEQVGGVLRSVGQLRDPYRALKDKLTSTFAPHKLDQVNSLIFGPELGGRRPSQLMETMLAQLPEGEMEDSLLFKGLFINRLPADLREQVSVFFELETSRNLAKLADSFWIARNSKRSRGTVAAVQEAEAIGQLEETGSAEDDQPVAAVRHFKKKPPVKKFQEKRKQQPVNTGNSRASSQVTVCSRHRKFGGDAWKCDDPSACFMSTSTQSGN